MSQLSPFPKFRAFNSNGAPLAGGKVYAFDAGTATPRSTYTDQGGGTPNAHPVVLDAAGEADIWLDGSYKIQLDDASDVTQWVVDNIEQFATTANATLSPSVGANAFQFEVSGAINEAASGTHSILGGVSITPPTINAASASVTEVASLYISDAPSAVGATAYALHVDAGNAMFDGGVTVLGTTTTNAINTQNQSISGSNAKLIIKDTDGVWGTAIPAVEFQDGNAAVGGSIGFEATTGFLIISNDTGIGGSRVSVQGADLEITRDSSNVGLIIKDGSTNVDNEATGWLHFQNSDGSPNMGHLGYISVTDSNLTLQNQVSGGHLLLITNGGAIKAASDLWIRHNGAPALVIEDSGTSVASEVQGQILFRDSLGAVLAQAGMLSAVDSNFEITNSVTNADIELNLTGTGEVVVAPTGSGALRIKTDLVVETGPGTQCDIILHDDEHAGNLTQHMISANDSADVVQWRLQNATGADDLVLTNLMTDASIEFTVTGADSELSQIVHNGFSHFNGNLRVVQGVATPQIYLRDTSAVGSSAEGRIVFEDSAVTEIGEIGFKAANPGDLVISNLISGGDIRLTVTGTSDRVWLPKHTTVSDSMNILQVTDTTLGWQLGNAGGYNEDDFHIVPEVSDDGTPRFLIDRSTGDTFILGSDPALVIRDTDGAWATAVPGLEFEDSVGTQGGSIRYNTGQSMVLTNSRSNGDMIFTTTGPGDYVFTNMPTSDPSVAGALWSNSGVVTISSG